MFIKKFYSNFSAKIRVSDDCSNTIVMVFFDTEENGGMQESVDFSVFQASKKQEAANKETPLLSQTGAFLIPNPD
jgi:hypothetical protein